MTALIVLFNLKAGKSTEDYEAWAKSRDVPTVKALGSVDDFKVYRAMALFGTDEKPPYRYVEVIDVANLGEFLTAIGTPDIRKVAAEFAAFADEPVFLVADRFA